MKFESIKTFILIILIGLSLMLTFSLWNFQPNYEPLYTNQSKYVNEVDLGGAEEKRKTIIKPSSIIFHNKDKHFGFADQMKQQVLFKEIEEWILTDLVVSKSMERPDNTHEMEVTFPNELPMEITRSLFNIRVEDALPNLSFNRMFVTFNLADSTLDIYFPSIDDRQQAKFTVNDPNQYKDLYSYVLGNQELSEYVSFTTSTTPIYIPKNEVEMPSLSFGVESIDASLLVNALFSNPSLVSPNIGEAYFTDGQRGMRLLSDKLRVEFINPIHSKEVNTDLLELLDRSLLNINEHKGWTDDYNLVGIDIVKNEIEYQMHYKGYPIYSRNDLTMIEQQWRNQELHQYSRPLFRLNNLLGEDVVKLYSGKAVINFLVNHGTYELEDISDIQLGYKFIYSEDASFNINLEPAWYMKYNENWQEIKFDDEAIHKMGRN